MKQAVLALFFSAMLHASAIISITPGKVSSRAGTTTIDFDLLGGYTAPKYSIGGVTYEWIGPAPFVSGSLVNNRVAPDGDTTVYLGVASPGYAELLQITFTVPIRYFGFYYGSPDTYNVMTAYAIDDLAGPSMGWIGTTLLPQGTLGAYVNFDFSTPVNKIIMLSAIAAFESDNHSYSSTKDIVQALPEVQSFFMVGLGVVALSALRRFRRVSMYRKSINGL